jgi:hypothetical protein
VTEFLFLLLNSIVSVVRFVKVRLLTC